MKSLNLTKPHLIIVVGIPGSGKTFFASQFAATFGAPFVNDQDIMDIVNDASTAVKVRNMLLSKLLSSKQTILVEGTGATKTDRRTLNALAHKHGYQSLYIWVQTEPATAQIRATKGIGRSKSDTLLSDSEFEERFAAFESLSAVEPVIVISGKHTYASQAKNVLKKLTEPRAIKAKSSTTSERQPTNAQQPTPRRGHITIN